VNVSRKWTASALLLTAATLFLSFTAGVVSADSRQDRRQDQRQEQRQEQRGNSGNRHDAPPPRGYVLDHRFSHDRYYPPRGFAVRQLPGGYYSTRYRGAPYFFHGGIWYRPYGPRYVVVRPPIGIFVPILPPFYTTIWLHGSPYYYADDTYYQWRAEERAYVVTEPPADAESTAETSAGGDEIFVYPKHGQSSEQQATDRYECHSWAVQQTGFDPTQPLGGVDESQVTPKRADYQRAEAACLDARGYSVK